MKPETISLFECVLNQDAPGVARAISQKAALDERCDMHIVKNTDGSERLCDCKEKVHRDLERTAYIKGRSPLLFAAMDGNIEIAELLISAGANVHSCDTYGKSALHYAALNYSPKVLKLLVDCGGYLDEYDNGGLTALDYLETSAKAEINGVLEFVERMKLKAKELKAKEALIWRGQT